MRWVYTIYRYIFSRRGITNCQIHANTQFKLKLINDVMFIKLTRAQW